MWKCFSGKYLILFTLSARASILCEMRLQHVKLSNRAIALNLSAYLSIAISSRSQNTYFEEPLQKFLYSKCYEYFQFNWAIWKTCLNCFICTHCIKFYNVEYISFIENLFILTQCSIEDLLIIYVRNCYKIFSFWSYLINEYTHCWANENNQKSNFVTIRFS